MNGIYHKYNVTHSDGSPVDGQCFVLKLSDPAARRALMTYAIAVQDNNPELSTDIALMVRNHNQANVLPALATQYCWSEDGEYFHGEHASIQGAAEEAHAQCDFDALSAAYIGEVTPGRDLVSPEHLGEHLDEHVRELLSEETADVAENFSLTPEQQLTLGQIVIDWIDLHAGFQCYGVKNIRLYRLPFDPADAGQEAKL